MICSAPTIAAGCGIEIVPVTATRVNGSHNLCITCAAVTASKWGIKVTQIRDLEWAMATVRTSQHRRGSNEIPPVRVRAAIQYIEDNPGKLTPPGKEKEL